MSPASNIDPRIRALVDAVEEYQLVFSIDDDDPLFRKLSYRVLRIKSNAQSIAIPVMDEFGDVAAAKPAVLLHLVLTECMLYEEATDFLVWCEDIGLSAGDDDARAIYFRIRESAPLVRSIVGDAVQPIPGFDIEFNTGLARALRGTG